MGKSELKKKVLAERITACEQTLTNLQLQINDLLAMIRTADEEFRGRIERLESSRTTDDARISFLKGQLSDWKFWAKNQEAALKKLEPLPSYFESIERSVDYLRARITKLEPPKAKPAPGSAKKSRKKP